MALSSVLGYLINQDLMAKLQLNINIVQTFQLLKEQTGVVFFACECRINCLFFKVFSYPLHYQT